MTTEQRELMRQADVILAKAARAEEMRREALGLPKRKKSTSMRWSFFIKTPCGGQSSYRRK